MGVLINLKSWCIKLAASKSTITGICLLLLVTACIPISSLGDVPSIAKKGEAVTATWELSTADNITLDNLSLENGKAVLSNSSGRFDLTGPTDFITGTLTNLTSIGKGLEIEKRSDWWDKNYTFRRPITILNKDGTTLPVNFTYNLTIDTASLVAAGKMKSDAKDLRIVKRTGGTFTELDRAVTSRNSTNTSVQFKGDTTLAPGALSSVEYYLYYGNPTATAPPQNKSRVFLYYDDFSTDTRARYTVNNCLLDKVGTTATLTHDAVNGRMVVTSGASNVGATLIAPVQAHNVLVQADMLVNQYYRQGQRDSNLEMVARYTDVNNFYVESYSIAWNDPSIVKWVGSVKTGPLSTDPGYHPAQNVEHLDWMSVMNSTIRGGVNKNQHLMATDASLGGNGNLGFGISSADGYIDNLTVMLRVEIWPASNAGQEEDMFRSPGTFVSLPIDATGPVIWNVINGSSVTPTGTAVVLNTRTSSDGSIWTAWSVDLTTMAGTSVKSPPGRYIQIKAVLKVIGTMISPSISWIGVNFTKYVGMGTLETKDISFSPVLGWTELNVTKDLVSAPGSSIDWEASKDAGLSWITVPTDGNISSLNLAGQLRLRATFKTIDTTKTPSLDEFSVRLRVDRAPSLKNSLPPLSFPEDAKFLNAVNLNTYFQDDGALIFSSHSTDANLSVKVYVNGTVDLTTTAVNWNGKSNVTFKATDAHGLWLEAMTEVTVTPVNDAPVISSLPPTTARVDMNYTFTVMATDIDKDALTYSLEKAPTGMTVGTNGFVKWVPGFAQIGPNEVRLVVTDTIVKVYQNFTVTVERGGFNRPPAIQSTPILTAPAEKQYMYQVVATDADNDNLTYSLNTAPNGMTIEPKTGLIDWTPSQSQKGTVQVVVNVTDGLSTITQTFTLKVTWNAPPVISEFIDQKLNGKEKTIDLSNYASDPDDPSSNLTWKLGNYSSNLFTASINGNTMTLTPLKGASGKGSVTLVLTDTKGARVQKEVVVEVKKVTKAKPFLSLDMIFLIVILLVIVLLVIVAIVATRKRQTQKPDRKDIKVEHVPGQILIAEPIDIPVAVTHVKTPEVKPEPAPIKVDESGEIAKATEFMAKILNAHIAEGLTKEEKDGLADALEKLDKDPIIRSIMLDDKGLISLEVDTTATLDNVAIAYSSMFDALTIACYSDASSKWDRKARQAATGVVQKVLGDEKGPAAVALRMRLLQGALSERLTTGIPGLDALLGGGIPVGEAVLFQVPAGSVKEVLMDQLLKETIRSNQGVVVTLSNISPARFLSESDKKKMKVKAWADLGELRIVDWHSYKTMRVKDVEEDGFVHKSSKSLTNLAIAITDASKKLKNDLVKRGLFDIITPAITIFGIDPAFKLVQSLVARLKEDGFTSIFLVETEMHEEEDIATLCQNFDTTIEITRKKDNKMVTMEVAVLSMSVPGYCSDVKIIEVTEEGLVIKDGR
jgi:KaiC/GvpD/RAD55 family RecA-like ATPase